MKIFFQDNFWKRFLLSQHARTFTVKRYGVLVVTSYRLSNKDCFLLGFKA